MFYFSLLVIFCYDFVLYNSFNFLSVYGLYILCIYACFLNLKGMYFCSSGQLNNFITVTIFKYYSKQRAVYFLLFPSPFTNYTFFCNVYLISFLFHLLLVVSLLYCQDFKKFTLCSLTIILTFALDLILQISGFEDHCQLFKFFSKFMVG